MNPIPLIHSEHALRTIRFIESAGIPADRYLEKAHIPESIREGAAGFLPGVTTRPLPWTQGEEA